MRCGSVEKSRWTTPPMNGNDIIQESPHVTIKLLRVKAVGSAWCTRNAKMRLCLINQELVSCDTFSMMQLTLPKIGVSPEPQVSAAQWRIPDKISAPSIPKTMKNKWTSYYSPNTYLHDAMIIEGIIAQWVASIWRTSFTTNIIVSIANMIMLTVSRTRVVRGVRVGSIAPSNLATGISSLLKLVSLVIAAIRSFNKNYSRATGLHEPPRFGS